MTLSKHDLLAYASEFTSFLLQSNIREIIERIIVFGSVARGNFDSESDIDVFVDSRKDIKKEVEKVQKTFELSNTYEKWHLKGLSNELSVKTGLLADWKLHREVISNGIFLYGPFAELPKEAQYICLLRLDFRKLSRAKKIKAWRRLYGYEQKVGKKIYSTRGFIDELGGKKIEKSTIILPSPKRNTMLSFLKKQNITYQIDDLWSDTLLK